MEVTYIDHMGDDLRVANAARVSFNKESEWGQDTPDDFDLVLKDSDERIISFLAKHGHWTPFSHCMVTLREKVPIFIARQRFKHMVGFTYNEVSRRYVDSPPEFYSPDVWRKRAEDKKQGSLDEGVVAVAVLTKDIKGEDIVVDYETFLKIAHDLYTAMIKNVDIAPEQARMILPQSMYTEYYVTGSLAAWARAYKLRSEETAQKEIQELASKWNEIIAPLFPVSWRVLCS